MEETKIKNTTLAINPQLYKILYPEDFETDEDGVEYVVPQTEKELRSVFDDLKKLGISERDEELPESRKSDILSQLGLKTPDSSNIDEALAGEIHRMKSAVRVDEAG